MHIPHRKTPYRRSLGLKWYFFSLFITLVRHAVKVFKAGQNRARHAGTAIAKNFAKVRHLPELPVVAELAAKGEAVMALARQRVGQAITEASTIAMEKAAAIRKLRVRLKERLARLGDQHARRMAALTTAKDRKCKRYASQKATHAKKASELEGNMEKTREKGGILKDEPPIRKWKVLLTALGFFVMGGGEWSALFEMFQQMLRDSEVGAGLFSATISVGLILASKAAGEAAAKMTTTKWGKWLVVAKATLTVTTVAAAIGWLRVLLVKEGGSYPDDEWADYGLWLAVAFPPTASFFLAFFLASENTTAKRTYTCQLKEKARIDRAIVKVDNRMEKEEAGCEKALVRLQRHFEAKKERIIGRYQRKEYAQVRELGVALRKVNGFSAYLNAFCDRVEAQTHASIRLCQSTILEHLQADEGEVPVCLTGELSRLSRSEIVTVNPASSLPEDYRDPGDRKSGQNGVPKPIRSLLSICLVAMLGLSACEKPKESNTVDVAIEILIDRTDSLLIAEPVIDASQVMRLSRVAVAAEDCGDESLRVGVSEITNSSFSRPNYLELQLHGIGNRFDCEDSVRAFGPRLQEALDDSYRPPARAFYKSKVFVSVCRALTRLVDGPDGGAGRKILIVVSDMIENGTVNFRREKKALLDHSISLETQMMLTCRLPDHLEGVEVYLLVPPSSEQDDLMLLARQWYHNLLSKHGANDVHFALPF